MHRSILAFGLFGCALVLSSSDGPAFTAHQKAYYLDPQQVAFVRPGLVIRISPPRSRPTAPSRRASASRTRSGLPLDRQGVTTPGAVATSFVAAYIPRGQEDYVAYTTRPQTSPITGVTAAQAAADAGGRYEQVGEGEYVYTFGTKAPAGFNADATHSIGVYATRNLAEFDLGSQFSNFVFNFVPNGSPVTQVHDIVRTQTCNKCHDPLMAHGGARQQVRAVRPLPHAADRWIPIRATPWTCRSWSHKIHMGEDLPSVQAGTPYRIIGFNQSVTDYLPRRFPGRSARPTASSATSRPRRRPTPGSRAPAAQPAAPATTTSTSPPARTTSTFRNSTTTSAPTATSRRANWSSTPPSGRAHAAALLHAVARGGFHARPRGKRRRGAQSHGDVHAP